MHQSIMQHHMSVGWVVLSMMASRFLKTLACRAQCPGAKAEAVPLDLAQHGGQQLSEDPGM